MPVLVVRTNVTKDREVLHALSSRLSAEVTAILGKPEKWMMIDLQPGALLRLGGDADTPCAACQLHCIGKIDVETNTKVSGAVAKALEEVLGVSPSRYYLAFTDYPATNMGWSGYTFGNLPKDLPM